MHEDELLHSIKDLVQAQLVVEESGDLFSFRHALTREAVYATLLVRERKRIHRAIATTLERQNAESLESHVADLAYHYYQAEAWDKAAEYSLRAGEKAHALYAPRETVEHITRALRSTRHLNKPALPLLYRLRGQAYELLGDFEHARKDQEDALQMAQQMGDRAAEWQSLIDLGKLWAGRDYESTGEYLKRAIAVARTMNDPAVLGHSLNRYGNWLVNTGDGENGLPMHLEALDLFEAQHDRGGAATTIDLIAMTKLLSADLLGSRKEYEKSIELFTSLNDKLGLASSLIPYSHLSYYADTVPSPLLPAEQDLRLSKQALEISRELGWMSGQAFAEWGAASRLLGLGEFGQALQHARESMRIAREIGHRQWIVAAHFVFGRIYLQLLQPDLAMQDLAQALPLARELGSAWWTGNISSHLAMASIQASEIGTAEAILDERMPRDHMPHDLAERWMAFAWGQLELARNSPEIALQIAQQLIDSAPGNHPPQRIPWLLRLKGDALAALGRLEEAERVLVEAKEGALQRLEPSILWRVHLSLSQSYQRQGRMDEAESECAAARAAIRTIADRIDDVSLREDFARAASSLLPETKAASPRRDEARQCGGVTNSKDNSRDIAF